MQKNNFLTANWEAPSRVKTLITTRSLINNQPFNLALHTNDDPEQVKNNRQILSQLLPNNPFWLNQTHSNKVINLDLFSNPHQSLDFDASITTLAQKVCVVLTADCLPIFLTDKAGSFVAAIHAGWRGLENQIITQTLKAIESNPGDILAYIGPAICQKHYQVSQDILEKFYAQNPLNQKFFHQQSNSKYQCNLALIAKQQMLDFKIVNNNIYLSNICTYCHSNTFYSYRKDKTIGRFASLIWLE